MIPEKDRRNKVNPLKMENDENSHDIQLKLNKLECVLGDSIDQAIGNMEDLDELSKRADEANQHAGLFSKKSEKVQCIKYKEYLKEKWKFVLIFIFIILFVVLFFVLKKKLFS